MGKSNPWLIFGFAVSLFFCCIPKPALAAVANLLNGGNNGVYFAATSQPEGGNFTNGQTVTFSGVVKQLDSLTASNYKMSFSSGVLEFYMMENAKVPLIDACNDEYYASESYLMYSCSTQGAVPTMSPLVPCPLKWPGCKWDPCTSCSSKVTSWCGSSKLPFCDEVDTVRTDSASAKVVLLGTASPSNPSNTTQFTYNRSFTLPTSTISGSVKFFVYYRGIISRTNPFGNPIILGGDNKTQAWAWQVGYTTATYTPCTCGSWTNAATCGTGSCGLLQRLRTRTCTPAGCQSESSCVNDATCCSCGAWTTSAACGTGSCTAGQRQQTRVCNPAACQLESQCINDVAGCCSCGAWTTSATCGTGSCTAGQRLQTRTCNIPGCQPESQCIDDVAGCCSCGAWTDDDCGTGTCAANQMRQTRVCTPAACLAESQCVASASCPRTLNVSVIANPDNGVAPLATNITGTVSGTATGTINYSIWADCGFACSTVADCIAACGAPDKKVDGIAALSENYAHTYFAPGSYTPKIIVERGTLIAIGTDTVTVNAAPTLNVTVTASPDNGNAPLNTTITGTVSGTAAGTIDYSVWFDCNQPCTTVADCTAVCNAPDQQAIGTNDTVKNFIHTYASPGNYVPKMIVTRGGLSDEGNDTVVVNVAPTLNVTVTASPDNGVAPLDTTITGTVSGTATGTINYKIWYDCDSSCASVASCIADCGVPDREDNASNDTTKSYTHTYNTAGTYHPRMIVERGVLDAEGGDTVTVDIPTLNVTVTASPDNGVAPLDTTITGTVSGTATGTINYKIWYDCDSSCASVASCIADCGVPDREDNASNDTTKSYTHTYNTAGTYHPRMIVERGVLDAEGGDTVTVNLTSQPPAADTLTKQNDYCASGLATMFSWTYSDPDNDLQAFRQIQVDDNADFSSPEDDTGKAATASASYVTLASKLTYDTTYHWRLKVWDSMGIDSGWIDGTDFSTPEHSYPQVAFSLFPASPRETDVATYTDQTQVFGGATVASRSWTIQGATPNTSVAETFAVAYATKGAYNTTLTVTDSDGYTCSLEKTINVKPRIPDWEE